LIAKNSDTKNSDTKNSDTKNSDKGGACFTLTLPLV
jgi:hypothetical protein